MDPVIAIAVAGGALVAVRALGKDEAATDEVAAAEVKKPVTGATIGPAVKAHVADIKSQALSLSKLLTAPSSTFQQGKAGGGGLSASAEKALHDKARSAYNSLSADAKKKACEDLKRRNPSSTSIQAIPCGASYDQVMKGIGAAGGVAACAATGAGATVAPLCGIAGSWIAGWAGPKAKEWASDAYDGVKGAVLGGAKAVIPFW